MRWISNLFSKANSDEVPSPSTGFHDLEGHPVPISLAAADVRAARELVHSAATRTAQIYGVPARWLAFEVVTIADDEKAYFQLQVIMKHWDEYMMAHSYAFERAVIKRITEDNQNVGRALRAVLWRVAADAGCPYDDMPESKAWTPEAVKRRGEVRDRINRELYAITTPASGALPAALMPVSADDAERAGRSTMPVKYDPLVDSEGFSDTRPTAFNGFAPTQPFDDNVLKNKA
jgi:type IV secretory pathway VirB3-like protein